MLTYKELNIMQAALTVQISRYKSTYEILNTDRERYIELQKECLMLYIKLDWELFDRFKVKSSPMIYRDFYLINNKILKEVKYLGREKE